MMEVRSIRNYRSLSRKKWPTQKVSEQPIRKEDP